MPIIVLDTVEDRDAVGCGVNPKNGNVQDGQNKEERRKGLLDLQVENWALANVHSRFAQSRRRSFLRLVRIGVGQVFHTAWLLESLFLSSIVELIESLLASGGARLEAPEAAKCIKKLEIVVLDCDRLTEFELFAQVWIDWMIVINRLLQLLITQLLWFYFLLAESEAESARLRHPTRTIHEFETAAYEALREILLQLGLLFTILLPPLLGRQLLGLDTIAGIASLDRLALHTDDLPPRFPHFLPNSKIHLFEDSLFQTFILLFL